MPCPFCGGEATLRPQGNAYTKSRKITVKCKDCRVELTHAAIHYGFDWLAEKIERDWNRRAAPQPQGGALTRPQVEMLRALLMTTRDRLMAVGFSDVNASAAFRRVESALDILAQSAPPAPQQAGDGLTEAQIETLWSAACEDLPADSRHLRFARAVLALAAPRQPGEMGARVQRELKFILNVMEDAKAGLEPNAAHRITLGKAIEKARAILSAPTASAQQDEREAFEAWLQPYWSRETYTDPDGDRLYRENWVQGAWIAWQARTSQQVQADAGPVSWRRVAYPDDVCVTKVERDAWLEEGWEVEALYTHPSPAGESDKRERFERFERIKRLALDAGGQGALPVPASLSKIVRECLDGIAAMSREQQENGGERG